jgi:FkbM family methyltransferase
MCRMKIFGTPFTLQEFVPPALEKLLQRIPFGVYRRHPFSGIPASLDARVILDVGANVGQVAKAGLLTYPRSEVYCFEPVSATFQALSRRLSLFGNRAKLYPFALSDENAEALINLTSFHGANSLHPQAALHKRLNPTVREHGAERIQLRRLDDMAGQLPARCDIMKIDVEGHELQVLAGGETFLRDRVDTVLIEISLVRDQSWERQSVFDVFATMNRLGFCLVNVMDLYRSHDPDVLLVQMDCVFRKRSTLATPTTPASVAAT